MSFSMTRYNISFAGAGRLAGSLCRELFKAGINILQIVSRNESDGRNLAGQCNAKWSSRLSFGDANDIIIVAVPDNSLKEVLSELKCSERSVIAHTAGSFGLDVFPAEASKTGVFYPLMTFSRGRNVSLRDIPVFIEGNDENTAGILKTIAEIIGGKVYFIDNESRSLLHVSAVFVNNFTNYMLTSGNEIASKTGLPFSIFGPLLKETVAKALEAGPEKSQTGPAVRNDLCTIEKHMELLSFSPDLQNLYAEVTKAITEHYKSVK
jgi:predicted short-subunit dehydrogenase-like oxidoreductase (DUF2520 family)